MSRLLKLILQRADQLAANPELAMDLLETVGGQLQQQQYGQTSDLLATLIRAHSLNAMLIQVREISLLVKGMISSIEEETDGREGKGRRCCLLDGILQI